MCNEKILGPFEENESEESENYRKKRAALLEATKQLESATKEALGIIAEFLVSNVKISTEATNTAELIQTLTHSKIVFLENDEFVVIFKRKNASGRISTTFKSEEQTKKALNEIKALRGFINSRATKAGKLGDNIKIKLTINKAFKNLEEAITDFSEL